MNAPSDRAFHGLGGPEAQRRLLHSPDCSASLDRNPGTPPARWRAPPSSSSLWTACRSPAAPACCSASEGRDPGLGKPTAAAAAARHWPPLSPAARTTKLLPPSCFLSRLAGIPFEEVRINLGKAQQRSPEFRAVNPLGKVPALQASGSRDAAGSVRPLRA